MILTKTPAYVNMSKSTGRPQSVKEKKDGKKEPGPATYNTEKSWERLSKNRSSINITFSGLAKGST